MNILFSISYYTPYVSGLTLCARRLAESFAKDYNVSVLTMRHEKKLGVIEQIGGVRVMRAKPLLKISKGFFSFDWMVKSWQEVAHADVVLINLPQFEGIIPALFARLYGKKVITIYHCEVVLPSGIFNRILSFFLSMANFITLLFSHEVVSYTQDYVDYSKVLRLLRSLKGLKIKTIYPPVPKPKVKPTKKAPEFIIGVAARLAAEKGIEYLLEALEYAPGKLIIAGSLYPVGETAYKNKIMHLVEKYKERVTFLGEIKPEDMGEFYAKLDVLVLPSINSTEAFGIVQVEAMLMGVPVVASDLPGVRVPIQKSGMGIVVPIKNPKALADAINAIIKNPKKFHQDQAKILATFSLQKSIESYRKLL